MQSKKRIILATRGSEGDIGRLNQRFLKIDNIGRDI